MKANSREPEATATNILGMRKTRAKGAGKMARQRAGENVSQLTPPDSMIRAEAGL